jgi:glyoxylate utilization-related uncharacterized protein
MRAATEGGFLELVSEWEIAGGGAVDAHSHPTHEFYYIIAGHGIMKIADEEREVHAGDLVYTPPDTTHSIWPASENAPCAAWPSPSAYRARKGRLQLSLPSGGSALHDGVIVGERRSWDAA